MPLKWFMWLLYLYSRGSKSEAALCAVSEEGEKKKTERWERASRVMLSAIVLSFRYVSAQVLLPFAMFVLCVCEFVCV